MAAAMKNREKCLTAIAKWQGLLAEAEAEIQALRESDVADNAAATEPATEPSDDTESEPAPTPSI
jgi:hypothetical protein